MCAMVWWWKKSLWRCLEQTLCYFPWGWGFGSTIFSDHGSLSRFFIRPGPAPDSFLYDLASLISTFPNDHIIILGDLNINFLDENETYDYKTIFPAYAFVNLITVPPRITSHGKSCLDHILVNFQTKILNQELLSLTIVTIYKILLRLNQLQIFNKLSALKRLKR